MADDSQIFDNLSSKFNCILYGRNEKQQKYVQSLLDELNNLNYKQTIVTNNNKAILLIHQLCTVVSPTDKEIVERCCKLIVNLVSHQRVNIAGRTLSFTLEWLIQIIKLGDVSINVLQCLECLIRDNVEQIQELLPELIEQLLKFIETEQNVQLWTVKCIEAVVYKNESNKNTIISNEILNVCSDVFHKILLQEKPQKCDEILYCKMINSCLRGLQNILLQSNDFEYDLGLLLGISRCYMAYYLFEAVWMMPQKIMPSNLSVADVKSVPKEKKGGKMTKQRKPRKSNTIKKDDNTKRTDVNNVYMPATVIPENTNVTISDSDYSDSETGKYNRIGVSQGRVRQAALHLLLSIVKVSDKHTMFGYWSSFFPDGSPSGIYNLNHCLLQEPSPRGRIAILNVISTILNGSKLYLSQAETSEKTFAFTPFSMILGSMIQELHKTLCMALKDPSIPVLTQILKCLSLLVQATPYHKISAGLVTLVFKNVQPFIRHRDATVQVAALIVLGCLIASEPTIKETLDNLIHINQNIQQKTNKTTESDQEIEYAEFSSSDDDTNEDIEENLQVNSVPWLLEKCLRNLKAIPSKRSDNVPAPVKLESLQVISVMCRNYFRELVAPHLPLISKGVEICLVDKYVDLKLHTGRTIDSIGHSMQQFILTSGDVGQIEKGLQFWQLLLNGPLIVLLQNDQHSTLRCIGCDCLGSIGADIFEHLPKDKQLLVISLLFANSRDEENNVRAAAVRALAISVLYPSLREDLGFVMDTAEAIIRTLDDTNLTVRIKSSWSLGNLSDALVLYCNVNNEELPERLIHELISSSIKISQDNNKIKCNATRALGNLLRLITIEMLRNINYKTDPLCYNYKEITEKAIDVLVKNSISCPDMKVRWNSCYAIGNFMKNCDLFEGSNAWQHNVYSALMDLVANFRNFKVRINAALALSVPEKRSHYGIYYFPVWKSLLNALDNAQNNEDFHEFKHKDNLVDQICLSLGHLIIFLTKDDLNTLHEILVYHSDALKQQMFRVQDRLVPEKSEILIRATEHINQMFKLEFLLENQRNVIEILQNVFNSDICNDYF